MQKVLQNCQLYGEVTCLFSHIMLLDFKFVNKNTDLQKIYQNVNRVSY